MKILLINPFYNSKNVAIRDSSLTISHNPKHLIFMDSVFALILLTVSGLRVVDYGYSLSFLAPSGHHTILSKIIFPLRYLLAKIITWVLSKTLCGVSLILLVITPKGLKEV